MLLESKAHPPEWWLSFRILILITEVWCLTFAVFPLRESVNDRSACLKIAAYTHPTPLPALCLKQLKLHNGDSEWLIIISRSFLINHLTKSHVVCNTSSLQHRKHFYMVLVELESRLLELYFELVLWFKCYLHETLHRESPDGHNLSLQGNIKHYLI